MLKDQIYQTTTTQEVRKYSINPIITSTSPRNMNVQNIFHVVPSSPNHIYSTLPNSINPQANLAKPVSVPVYSTVQSPKHFNFTNTNGGIAQNVGAIGTMASNTGFEQSAGQIKNGQSTVNGVQNYHRFSTGGKIIPTRPNYHFFGTDSRQQISRSNSPPVQIKNQNQNSQSRSYSPLSIRSHSSEANKVAHRVRFSYNYGATPAPVQSPSQLVQLNQQTQSFHPAVQNTTINPQPQIYPAQVNQQSLIYSISQPQQHQYHIQQHGPVAYNIQQQNHQLQSHQNQTPIHAQYQFHSQLHPQPQPHLHIQYQQQNQNNSQQQQQQQQQQQRSSQIQNQSLLNPQNQIYSQGQDHIQAQGQGQIQHAIGNPFETNQIVHINSTVVHTTTVVWEHRFVEIYTKFQIFVQRFQSVIEEIYGIDDMFDNVNDEEAWNDLRLRYSDMIQSFNIMREEIIMVLEQNKAAINSLSPEVVREINQKNMLAEQQKGFGEEGEQGEERQQRQQRFKQTIEQGDQTGKSGSENNHVWQNRCLELMQQHQILTKQNNELKQVIQQLKSQEHDGVQSNHQNKQGEIEGSKVAELQKNLNIVHSEYQKLEDNYNRISVQYSRVLSELQNRAASKSSEGANQQIAEMEQQLQMAQGKINELYEQLQEKIQHVAHYEKEMEGYGEAFEQNKKLIQTLNKNYADLDSYQQQIKSRDEAILQYNTQINRLNQLISQINKGQQNKDQSSSNASNLQLNAKIREIQSLKQQQKSLLTLIQKHESSIEQMVRKNQKINIEYDAAVKERDNQIKLLEKFLEQQRQSKKKLLNQSYQNEEKSFENIAESKIFKERLQIEVEQAVNEKNRKIRHLTQDLEELKYQIQNLEKQKQKQIKQIKLFFTEEQQKYTKKISEKQASIRILQEKTKSFENELSNKNLEISRFRHQSPVNSFNGIHEESRRQNETLERKNHEIQQLKRLIQQKSINIKELQQKSNSLEQEVHSKVFEINSLKREVNDQHGNRAEIDNLNNIIKKKNQQLNQVRLSVIEMQQLRMNIDSLERQKIRLNQYLKEKTRECEAKDASILSFERKLSSMSASIESYGIAKKVSSDGPSPSVIANYENLLKQRQSQIKSLKYEVQMLQTKVSISQKTIRDLNTKVGNYQKSSSILKADMQNKVSRYQTDIKSLNKEMKSLKDNKQELRNIIDSLQSKNSTLQKSLDQRNSLFDKQIARGKQKASSFQTINANLVVDQELQKGQIERLTRESKDKNEKIKALEAKISEKNNAINELKEGIDRKQRQDSKAYEERVKKLDNQLKLSLVKIKNLQQQIANLNKKISFAQNEKKSYRDRLITQHNSPLKPDMYDINRAVASEYESAHLQSLEMEKFRLKDPQANDVFERKVIYQLKKQNDFLRRELSNVGQSTYSLNKYDNQIHRLSYQEFYTDRQNQREQKQDESNNQIIMFYKNKNKELESRIDELLRLNNQLKIKISSMNPNSNSQMSVQFYKDQVTKLQQEVNLLQAKIKKMLADQKSVVEEASGHQHQIQRLKQQFNDQNLKIGEYKNTIRSLEDQLANLENIKAISYAEIERLKQMIQKAKGEKEELSRKQKSISQLNRKNKSLEQEITKLNYKINLSTTQIQRLNELLKSKKNEQDSKYKESSEETQKLKRRILELQRELQAIKLEYQTRTGSQADNAYKIEKVRSYVSQIDCLIGQIPVQDRRGEQIMRQVRHQIQQTLNTIGIIQV